jgi:hypothetical protein
VLRSLASFALPARPWLGVAALLVGVAACGQAPDHAAPAGTTPPAALPNDSLTLGDAAGAEACVGVEVKAAQLPVDLFAVVDGSSSMDEATFTGVSKWYATKAAFADFLRHAPRGMGFGLSLFPVPGDDTASCATAHYRDAAMPIDDVSQMVSGALARLDAVTPHGQTPTAPALTAALDLATAYGVEHVDRSVIVVLATDGLPTTCAPTDVPALAALAKEALDGAAHVRTLVVASLSLAGTDISGFDRIAAAGGTTHALGIDPHADFAQQLADALGVVAARQVACDLALPEPPPGQHLDYDAVNVVLDGKAGRTTLPRVSGSAKCTAAGGWYYDLDPARGAPSRLNMCKSSCERTKSATTLRVELGCKTVVR